MGLKEDIYTEYNNLNPYHSKDLIFPLIGLYVCISTGIAVMITRQADRKQTRVIYREPRRLAVGKF